VSNRHRNINEEHYFDNRPLIKKKKEAYFPIPGINKQYDGDRGAEYFSSQPDYQNPERFKENRSNPFSDQKRSWIKFQNPLADDNASSFGFKHSQEPVPFEELFPDFETQRQELECNPFFDKLFGREAQTKEPIYDANSKLDLFEKGWEQLYSQDTNLSEEAKEEEEYYAEQEQILNLKNIDDAILKFQEKDRLGSDSLNSSDADFEEINDDGFDQPLPDAFAETEGLKDEALEKIHDLFLQKPPGIKEETDEFLTLSSKTDPSDSDLFVDPPKELSFKWNKKAMSREHYEIYLNGEKETDDFGNGFFEDSLKGNLYDTEPPLNPNYIVPDVSEVTNEAIPDFEIDPALLNEFPPGFIEGIAASDGTGQYEIHDPSLSVDSSLPDIFSEIRGNGSPALEGFDPLDSFREVLSQIRGTSPFSGGGQEIDADAVPIEDHNPINEIQTAINQQKFDFNGLPNPDEIKAEINDAFQNLGHPDTGFLEPGNGEVIDTFLSADTFTNPLNDQSMDNPFGEFNPNMPLDQQVDQTFDAQASMDQQMNPAMDQNLEQMLNDPNADPILLQQALQKLGINPANPLMGNYGPIDPFQIQQLLMMNPLLPMNHFNQMGPMDPMMGPGMGPPGPGPA